MSALGKLCVEQPLPHPLQPSNARAVTAVRTVFVVGLNPVRMSAATNAHRRWRGAGSEPCWAMLRARNCASNGLTGESISSICSSRSLTRSSKRTYRWSLSSTNCNQRFSSAAQPQQAGGTAARSSVIFQLGSGNHLPCVRARVVLPTSRRSTKGDRGLDLWNAVLPPHGSSGYRSRASGERER